MKIVYFNPELSARAPDLLGVFCLESSGLWLTPQDIDNMLLVGESVEIRQATETELERAMAVVVLYEIELQLAQQVGGLLDPRDTATESVAAIFASALAAETAVALRDQHPSTMNYGAPDPYRMRYTHLHSSAS